MESVSENVCCHTYSKMVDRMSDTNVQCITEHPAFNSICLDKWNLEECAYQYVEEEGPLGDEEQTHEYVCILHLQL